MNDTLLKYVRLVAYLTVSNGLGYVLSTYVLKDPLLTAVVGPSINLVIYLLQKELSDEGVIREMVGK